MLEKLLAYFGYAKIKPEPPPQPQQTELRFIFNPEQSIDLTIFWHEGEEKAFAELIYALNSGILLEYILSWTKELCAKQNRDQSYVTMVTHLNKLFEEESKLLAQYQTLMQSDDEDSKDEPLISPSDVFGGKHDNALTSEGQDEEI